MKKTGIFKLLAGVAMVTCAGFGVVSNHAAKEQKTEAVEIKAASPDYSGYRYRFEVPGDFDNIWLMAWGSNGADFTDWSKLTNYSYNASSNKIFTFCTNVYYSGMCITRYGDNVDYCKSADISIGNRYNATWSWDGVSGHTPSATFPTGGTYYLYDYTNMFGGNAKCYAWQSNGNISNANWPGVDMTPVQYGSGQLYSISLDNIFDMAIFGIGDSANTGDQWINQHRGECFCWWDTDNGGFNADLNWIKAHDWIYQTMHVRDIQTTNNDDTGACRGDSGYYKKAKESYQSFNAQIKTKISEDERFGIACDRFHAWSLANGEDAIISGNSLTVNKLNSVLMINSVQNDTSLVIVLVVSILSISTLGALLVIKRKKHIKN